VLLLLVFGNGTWVFENRLRPVTSGHAERRRFSNTKYKYQIPNTKYQLPKAAGQRRATESLRCRQLFFRSARTRISSVKFAQRTVPVESIRNSAGRETFVPFRPSALVQKIDIGGLVLGVRSVQNGEGVSRLFASGQRIAAGYPSQMATGS